MKHVKPSHIVLYALLLAYAVLCLYPFIWMFLNSFKSNEEIFATNPFGLPAAWDFANYVKSFTTFRLDVFFRNSVLVASGTVVLTVLTSSMFAYSVSRMKWRLRGAAYTYLSLGIMIPVQVTLIPLVVMVRTLGLYNSSLGLMIAYAAFNVSFASVIFYGYFRTLPFELEEAACMDGASIYRTFFTIIVPVVKPAIATVVVFIFINSWNEFTLALVLTNKNAVKTLPIGLLAFLGEHSVDWGGMFAALVVASLPTMLVYLLFSESVEKALTVGAVSK